MKKIYLLSAAALFAFSASAQNWNEWYVDGAQKEDYTLEQVSSTNMQMAKVVVNDKCANEWDVEFCNVFHEAKGQEEGAMFTLDFDVMWEGETSDTATIYTLTGKLLNAQHDDWQWSGYGPQDDGSINEDGNTELLYLNEAGEVISFWAGHNKTWKLPKGELVHVTWGGKIGKKGADWIGVQINLYDKVNYGNFYFANMVAQFGKKKMEFFMNGGTTAVSETAAMKAYVANDVLYASEAADVVVYNINGVAVKSAKNVTSLNVADLKAGLYIAKFGNATVKFVK